MTKFIITSTLKDLLRPQRSVAWIAVVFIVFVISKVWSLLAPDLPVADSFGRVYQAVVLSVVALAAAVFGTMVLSQEVEQKTIVYLITRPIPRKTLLFGRMVASAIVAFGVGMLALLAAGVAVLGFDLFRSPTFFQDAAVIAVGVLAYTGFFVFLSLAIRRSLLFSLLFAFGWETFVPNMPGDMYYVSIRTYLRSAAPEAVVAAGPSLGDVITGSLAPKSVPQGLSWIILLLITVSMWLLSLWWFSRFEYTPRDEGE